MLSLPVISSCYLFLLSLPVISSCYLFLLSLPVISSCYLFLLYLPVMSSCYLFLLSLPVISSCYLFLLSLPVISSCYVLLIISLLLSLSRCLFLISNPHSHHSDYINKYESSSYIHYLLLLSLFTYLTHTSTLLSPPSTMNIFPYLSPNTIILYVRLLFMFPQSYPLFHVSL